MRSWWQLEVGGAFLIWEGLEMPCFLHKQPGWLEPLHFYFLL